MKVRKSLILFLEYQSETLDQVVHQIQIANLLKIPNLQQLCLRIVLKPHLGSGVTLLMIPNNTDLIVFNRAFCS
jgi:hypothetical protein